LLGYENSDLLFYQKDIIAGDTIKQYLSSQMYRVVKELNPNAIFCTDNKPFIAFFEDNDNIDKQLLYKKIWNTQIPVVFLINADKIEIFNGCSLDTKTNELVFVDRLSYEKLDINSEFSFWNITHPNFWNKYKSKFSTPKIDSIMLENIRCITQLLKKSNCAEFSITIVLRLIFIRFLIDRGVDLDYQNFSGSINESQEAFLNMLRSKEELYKLFKHLKNKFNGNLFEIYYDKSGKSESDLLDDHSLHQLYDLMAGELEIKTGQLSLFPLYDFNIIPIELISNIYERFLGNKKQKEDSAFYTPAYLVDYILNQTIKPYVNKHQICTVLDPACGSGIFLVETLRSIIEANSVYEPYINDNEKLVSLIKNNIFGIDKNPEAINVAIFSIYVTLLDYKDPKTLKDFKLPLLRDSNFFVCDFFDDKVKDCLNSIRFDFIIGNPPWGRMDTGLHIDYCKQHSYPQQNNEIARSFIYRTKDFCHEKTKCCLIVTSKIFYNMQLPAVKFRKWLLYNSRVIKFIELSAVRELIFQKARGPASVVFYNFSDDIQDNLQNDIDHIVLMPNLFFKLFNIILVEKSNYKYITQKLLYNDDWAWKTVAFGSIKDYLLIKQLKDNYRSLKEYIKENSFIYGTGIQTSDGTKDTSHLLDKKLIDSKKGIEAFRINLQYCQNLDKKAIHRIRDERLFKPPYVLIKKGFNTQTYKLRAAYTSEPFLYRDAITGIVGDNEEILLSIMGLINSSFYSYLNLMLGTSTGIEREQGFPTEIMKFPALIDKKIAEKANQVMEHKQKDNFIFDEISIEEKIVELDSYVLQCFKLEESNSIKYILDVQIPLLTGRLKYNEVTYKELLEYAEVITDYFDKILLSEQQFISVKIYNNLISHYAAIEFIISDDKPVNQSSIIDGSNIEETQKLDLFNKFMLTKINDMFYQKKDIIDFEENSFYILKSNEAKNWHKAIAELDLSDIIDSILSQEGESI
jgi:hypothetical protein